VSNVRSGISGSQVRVPLKVPPEDEPAAAGSGARGRPSGESGSSFGARTLSRRPYCVIEALKMPLSRFYIIVVFLNFLDDKNPISRNGYLIMNSQVGFTRQPSSTSELIGPISTDTRSLS
jgi:hypothetical protein